MSAGRSELAGAGSLYDNIRFADTSITMDTTDFQLIQDRPPALFANRFCRVNHRSEEPKCLIGVSSDDR
jgi:hypothetical protein